MWLNEVCIVDSCCFRENQFVVWFPACSLFLPLPQPVLWAADLEFFELGTRHFEDKKAVTGAVRSTNLCRYLCLVTEIVLQVSYLNFLPVHLQIFNFVLSFDYPEVIYYASICWESAHNICFWVLYLSFREQFFRANLIK